MVRVHRQVTCALFVAFAVLGCGGDAGNAYHTAGTPWQDPVVMKVRNDFTQAHAPKYADLHAPDVWNCTKFSAMKNDFSRKNPFYYSFSRLSGRTDIVANDGDSSVKSFTFSDDALVGAGSVDNNDVATEFIRLLQNGDIVIEVVKESTINMAQAVSDNQRGAYGYLTCPVEAIIH